MTKNILVACCCFLPLLAMAQPATDIFLFDIRLSDGGIILENARNITNRQGYDNQPFFHPDKPVIYFVSADKDGRTDIFEHNFEANSSRQITHTAEREYSPTLTPDKKFISCIIQRDNGAQDLGKYPIAGGTAEIIVDTMLVGYHAWANASQLALFALPQPFRLYAADLKRKKTFVAAEQIGRSLHQIPGREMISFIAREGPGWIVNSLDITTGEIRKLASTPPIAGQDMAWTPEGGILISDDKRILYLERDGETWREVVFQSFPVTTSISRIAIHPNGKLLALVIAE